MLNFFEKKKTCRKLQSAVTDCPLVFSEDFIKKTIAVNHALNSKKSRKKYGKPTIK